MSWLANTGIVTQRNNYDCGLCCLAMALGLSYEDASSLLPVEPGTLIPVPPQLATTNGPTTMRYGVTPGAAARILLEEGVASGQFAVEDHPEALAGDFTVGELLRVLQRQHLAAIIFVDTPGSEFGHALYWDDADLIDPKDGKTLNETSGCILDSEITLIENAYAVTFIYREPLDGR